MIKGHGDDAYSLQQAIAADFSSNICPHADHLQLMQHLAQVGARLIGHYPEPEAWTLERQLARHHGVAPECVIVTNGATEAIYLVAQAFRLRPVISQPTFSEYADACRLYPPDEGQQHTVCWICNPCNPTGRVTPPEEMERLAATHDLLVVDQSYEVYTRLPLNDARWACKQGNVVQLHSMTKTYAVPGLRLGYIIAAQPLTDAIRHYLRPWAVSALAIEAGRYLLDHHQTLRVCPDLDEAQRLWRKLGAIDGIEVQPTDTTFMLCRITGRATAAELKQALVHRWGLLIRDASNFQGLSPQHFRVASQTSEANDTLITAINRFLHA